jgi:hypothetical protein
VPLGRRWVAGLAAAGLLAGCAAGPRPVEVERVSVPLEWEAPIASSELGLLSLEVFHVSREAVLAPTAPDFPVLRSGGSYVTVWGAVRSRSRRSLDLVAQLSLACGPSCTARQVAEQRYYLPAEFPPLRNGTLLPGAQRRFGAVFEVPAGAGAVELHFRNFGSFSGWAGTWVRLEP